MALDVFDSAEESDGQAQSSARRQCKDLLAARGILHKAPANSIAYLNSANVLPILNNSPASISVFLGADSHNSHYFAVDFTDVVPDSDVQAKLSAGEVEWVESRPGFFQLDESELEIASVGKSLIDWNVRNVSIKIKSDFCFFDIDSRA
ncbi:hypothetical protein HK098_006161 [Nowakowskiella sp. JEL0407]|nr:hypothetical protein HK098_006161 [Nowakowskiella sp. JEL0407]